MKRITELLKRLVILVLRAIWPVKGKGSVQKMSMILVALSFLLGMIDPSAVEEKLFGSDLRAAEIHSQKTSPTSKPKLAVNPGAYR